MKRIVLGLVVVLLVAVGGCFFWVNTAIKKGVETYGSKITGTQVTLHSSHISFLSGKGSLNGLLVANPEGFSTNDVFQFGEISIQLDIKSLFSDTILVKDITIIDPEINYEFGSNNPKDSNVDALKRNVKKNSAEDAEPVKGKNDKPLKKLIVENLYIKNGKVSITSRFLGKETHQETKLPDIHLTNIGKSKGGLPPEQVSAEVLKSVTGELVQVVGGAIKKSAKGFKDALKSLF